MEAAIGTNVHTVSSLTELVKQTLSRSIPYVWVQGEVTNFSRAASGHIYFAVKDINAQLQCVWFASRQGPRKFDPLTGEVFDSPQASPAHALQNGLQILCGGSIDVYASRGQYQLIIDQLIPSGSGLLALEFEKRKQRLAQAGYFDLGRKRLCPTDPRRIAVITSPRGAAIHDFLELASKRGSGSVIRIFPVQVQGEGAAEKMARAIAVINAANWADVIVLIRGGGSLEDLWAFNEEILAAAIFNSRLPILAGIGHEVDFTLADMTADLRAATPSHAAQLLWPLRREMWQRLDHLQMNLDRIFAMILNSASGDYARISALLNRLSPSSIIARKEDELGKTAARLYREMLYLTNTKAQKYESLLRTLPTRESMSGAFKKMDEQRAMLLKRMMQASSAYLGLVTSQLDADSTALTALDPGRPLQKGYAILYDTAGILTKTAGLKKGEQISAFMSDGKVTMQVMDTEPGEMPPFCKSTENISNV